MMVSPSATSAASTSEADARKSEASTAAALSGLLPRTIARRPSIFMFAPIRTSSFNVRTHLIEQRREIGNFGFSGAILHHRLAVCERGCHQQVLGTGYGDLLEDNVSALEAVSLRLDVAVLLRDLRYHFFEAFY